VLPGYSSNIQLRNLQLSKKLPSSSSPKIMSSARATRSSARIAKGNSKYSGSANNAKKVRLESIRSPHGRKMEYESPRNRKTVPRSLPSQASLRKLNQSPLSRIEEESEESDQSDGELETNPVDMISAAATHVELFTQARNVEILEHQCMVVQQDFDLMLAEKDAQIDEEKHRRESAEKRALEAEARCKALKEELMSLKCTLFEKTGEMKAKSITQAAETPVTLEMPRKRRHGAYSPMPSVSHSGSKKRLRLTGRRGSF